MKASTNLQHIPLEDRERVDHIPRLMEAMADALESRLNSLDVADMGAQHGKLRCIQKYSLPLMLEEARNVALAIYQTIKDKLLWVDLRHMVDDLRLVNRALEVHLIESLKPFTSKDERAA